MKNTITEIKNTLEGINSRLDDTEELISKLDDRVMEITQAEQRKGKGILKNKDSLRDLWDNIKGNNICLIVVPEGQETERNGREQIWRQNNWKLA